LRDSKRPDRSPLPIHPVLFALFPLVSVLSANISQLRVLDAGRSVALALVAAMALVLVYSLILRDLMKAALVASATILLFFTYGHAYSILKTISISDLVFGRHRFLLPASVIVLIIMFWWAARSRGSLAGITRLLNVIAGIALLLPCASLVGYFGAGLAAGQREPTTPNPWGNETFALDANELPDIYYIITDAYARSDVLLDDYHYDNSAFLESLEGMGFIIADRSVPNYFWTHLALAAALNMDYVPDLLPGWTQGEHIDTADLIKHSRVRSRLEGLGYSTVGFATGWEETELFDADYLLTPDISRLDLLSQQGMFNEFEGLVIHSSALRAVQDLDARSSTPVARYIAQRMQRRYTVQREIILAEFENLQQVPKIPGPKFVFVHIISPHGPYIFAADGQQREQSGPFSLTADTDAGPEQEAEAYVGQLEFISSQLEETIRVVLSESDRPVIIVLQSDHGPGRIRWEAPEAGPVRARAANLNAYYLPVECRHLLSPMSSPVNTFRIVFNCVFGDDLPLLEDVTYVGYEEFLTLDEYLARYVTP